MKLTTKAELALIARLKQHQALAGVTFRQQADEAPKTYGTIVVACQQGEESSPPSGVYNLDAQITLLYPVRRPAGDSLTDYEAKCSAIEDVLNVYWLELSKQLTATRNDWHCYEIRVSGIESQPTEKAHQAIYSCKLVAMSQTFDAAAKLSKVS
jgi:hypothetical protein